MRNFPHPIVIQQISAGQGEIPVCLGLLFVTVGLPTLLTHGLRLWSPFTKVVANHPAAYLVSYFILQTCLVYSAVLFATRRYAPTLWTPATAI